LSATAGTLIPGEEDARVDVTVDWNQVPLEFNEEVLIDIRSTEGDFEQVHLPILGREVPVTFSGFVESDGYISIPAPSCVIAPSYRVLPEAGRSSTGSVALGPASDKGIFYLTYKTYFFTNTRTLELLLYFNMTLDVDLSYPMTYSVIVDGNPQTHELVPGPMKDGELPKGWSDAVQDCVWVKKHMFSGNKFGPGEHMIQVKLRHSNLFLEKLVVDLGGVKESYLGPPPSFCIHMMEQ
jgi:hypothetical protein